MVEGLKYKAAGQPTAYTVPSSGSHHLEHPLYKGSRVLRLLLFTTVSPHNHTHTAWVFPVGTF